MFTKATDKIVSLAVRSGLRKLNVLSIAKAIAKNKQFS